MKIQTGKNARQNGREAGASFQAVQRLFPAITREQYIERGELLAPMRTYSLEQAANYLAGWTGAWGKIVNLIKM